MKSLRLALFAVMGAIMASGAAHALTYDTHSYRNADGSSKFQDPDESLQNDSDKESGFSMKFSGGSSNGSQYPDSASRLFLPQSGRAAASPYGGSDGFDSALGNNRHW